MGRKLMAVLTCGHCLSLNILLLVKIICSAINFRFNCQVNEVMISHVRGRSQQIIGTSQLATNSIEDNKKPHEKQANRI